MYPSFDECDITNTWKKHTTIIYFELKEWPRMCWIIEKFLSCDIPLQVISSPSTYIDKHLQWISLFLPILLLYSRDRNRSYDRSGLVDCNPFLFNLIYYMCHRYLDRFDHCWISAIALLLLQLISRYTLNDFIDLHRRSTSYSISKKLLTEMFSIRNHMTQIFWLLRCFIREKLSSCYFFIEIFISAYFHYH